MKVYSNQLPARLNKGLEPVYFLHGEETLLMFEAAEKIRALAREQGYTERLVFEMANKSDWSEFFATTRAMSLFGDRQLLDVRLNMGRPDEGARAAMLEYLDDPSPDHLVLFTAAKLESGAVRNLKWFRAMENKAVTVQFWPIKREELPGWIRQRSAGLGLQLDNGAVALLAERAAGNLLAASQEIEKLLLLCGEGKVSLEQMAEASGESARYKVYELGDTALSGDKKRLVRMLHGLEGEGVANVQILWWLASDIRALAAAEASREQGGPIASQLQKFGVRDRRKPLFDKALRRTPPGFWGGLLERCARLDRLNKGLEAGNAWDELLELGLMMADGKGAAGTALN